MATALNSYLITKLGRMATYLEWTSVSTEITLVIEDTLELLGLASEAASTDSVALKAVARYVLWEAVMMTLSTDYDFKADKASYSRSQLSEMAKENYINAKKNAMPYLSIAQIFQGDADNTQDPYKERDLNEFADRANI